MSVNMNFTAFMGVVEDVHDPDESGRYRVRVYGHHTQNKAELPTAGLQWFPALLNNSAGVSGIGDSPTGYVAGSVVFGYFYDNECVNGFILGSLPGVPTKKADTKLGFNDPTGIFPVFINEPDVNRLARNKNVGDTIENFKATKRVKNIPGARPSDRFNEPASSYGAEYPYNRVFETLSGHVVEFDDTPGKERISINHRSGTFEDYYPDGSKVEKTFGKKTEMYLGDNLVYIKGDLNQIVSGEVNTHVVGEWRVKASKAIFDCDVYVYGESNANDHISSNVSGKDHNHSGVKAGPDKSGPPVGKVEGMYTPSAANDFMYDTDDAPWSQDKIAAGIAAGYITQEQMDAVPEEVQKDVTEQTKVQSTMTECGIVITNGEVDYSTQLSPSFILRDVSLGAAASQYRIVAQGGLSEQEIACNLKNLALNVLEPLKAQYTNMFVTSGFREGTGSQHNKGEAVDIQFRMAKKSDYYDIAVWIKNNLPYDQLLLEWKNTGSRMPWIHISLKEIPSANRHQVLTFWNNRTYAQGLVDLSGS